MGMELIKDIGFDAKSMRLPYAPDLADAFGIDNVRWKVLTDATFPNATTVDSIIMALAYCRSRNLDVFKRPVHIVPMYSSVLKKMVDTVWPSISELRTTAFRTGLYAGRDKTEFGDMITEKVGKVEVTHPEYAQITVYRIVGGQRCAFPGPQVDWHEAYAKAGRDDESPNAQWQKRPRGQIEKCAEAAALRGAFPEEIGGEYAAEEMEGQRIISNDAMISAPTQRRAPPPPEIEHRPSIIDAARDAATRSRKHFDPWYANLTQAEKDELAPHMADLMASAKAASKRNVETVDAKTGEITEVKDAPRRAPPPPAAIAAPTPPTMEALRAKFAAALSAARDEDEANDAYNQIIDPWDDQLFPPDLAEFSRMLVDRRAELEP